MDLDDLSIRRVPTQRGLPRDRTACDGNGIWTRRQRWSNRRTWCVDRGPAYIPLKHIRPRICLILDIQTTTRRVIEGYLDRGISDNEISPEKVTLHSRRKKDSIRIA